MLGVAAVIGVEWLFVHFTGALQQPGPPARVAGQHHLVVVIAMLLGGVEANIAGLTVNDPTAVGQLLSLLLIPAPVIASLAIGLLLGGYRPAALASFAILLGIGAWARRFGPRGANTAVLIFIGDFIGFFLYGVFTFADLGWLAAEVGLAAVTLIAVRFTLFFPNVARDRRRIQRSYVARARRVAALALAVFSNGEESARHRRQLRRQLVRLNEAALIIDSLLAARDRSGPVPEARRARQLLFDLELALTNMARFAEALATADLSDGERRLVSRILAGVGSGDVEAAVAAARALRDTPAASSGGGAAATSGRRPPTGIILQRLAGTVEEYYQASRAWSGLDPAGDSSGGDEGFEPAVTLSAGLLPGATNVSAEVAAGRGGGAPQLRLAPSTRAGIQVAVAVGASIAAGYALSPRRFYWAVLAAFISFLGVSHSLEQVRKAAYRVIGTLVGIVIGSLLVDAVGHRAGWSLAVILSFLFLGVYLFRVNYTFMAIAITVVVSQLYVQLGEFSNALLLLRLEETAVGAVIAMLTGVLVVPVSTRRVLSAALVDQMEAVCSLARAAAAQLCGHGSAPSLYDAARAVDSAYQALLATASPVRWGPVGDVHRRLGTALAAAGAARNYSRNLVFDSQRARLHPPADSLTGEAVHRLESSVEAVTRKVRRARDGAGAGAGETAYVRSASLFEAAAAGVGAPACERGGSAACGGDRPGRPECDLRASDGHLDGSGDGGQDPDSDGAADSARTRLALRDFQLLDGALARVAWALGADVASLDVASDDEPLVGTGRDRP